MPTRSRPGYLREAVSSALAQDSDDFEVLISQDRAPQGLDGETEELCRALAATDARVRYVAQPRALGLAGNWNALADLARGEYLALLGDDDRLLPGFVTRLLAALRAERGVLAFGNHWVVDAGGRRDLQATESFTRRYGRASLHAGRVEPGVAAWGGMIPACAMAVRTDAVRRLRFSEDLNTPELELFVRLAAEGGPFVYVGERLAEYRVHAASATSGGLWIDRFAARLVRIEVAPEVGRTSARCSRASSPWASPARCERGTAPPPWRSCGARTTARRTPGSSARSRIACSRRSRETRPLRS